MLPGFAADPSAARPRADRVIAAAGRLAAGLAAALGIAAPLHVHVAGQPQSAPHVLGGAWALAGIAAWCSGASRRSAALGAAWLGLAAGLWAGVSLGATPIDAAIVCLAAIAVLVHDRNVNTPPSELLGHAAELDSSGKPVPAPLAKKIGDMRKQVEEQRSYIARKEKERDDAVAHFDDELAHYRSLKPGDTADRR